MRRRALGLLAAALLAGVAALAFALYLGAGDGASGGGVLRPSEEREAVAARPGAQVARPETPAADPPLAAGTAVETGARAVVGTARPAGLPAGTRQTLSGRVVGAGAPVAGAQVLYMTRDGAGLAEVASDAKGAFEIAAPYPLEDGLILIQARGFAPLESGPHAIRGGERRFVGNLEVKRGVPLSGKVVGAGVAIAGARVNLRAAGPGGGYNRHVQRAVADERGAFRFPDAPTGDVLVEAHAQGFGSRGQDLLHQAASDHLTVELLPEHVLFALVQDDAGAPVPDARLHLRAHDPRSPLAEAQADAGGVARVTGLGSLLWEVRVEKAGFRPGLKDRVEANGEPVVIELQAWPCIRGKVVRRDGSPAPEGTTVEALASNARGSFQESVAAPAPVEADGSFTLCDLRPGLYVVRATAPGFAPTSSSEQRLTLSTGTDGVRIELLDGGGLELAVQRDGRPLAAATVELYDRTPPPAELFRTADSPAPASALAPLAVATTEKDGRARFQRLAPGRYWCLVRANGLLAQIHGPVSVSNAAVERAGPVLLTQGGRLFGTLLGMPEGAADPVVNLFGEGGLTRGVPVLVQADAAGAWSSPLLPPGSYRVTARVLAGQPSTAHTAIGQATVAAGQRAEVKLRFE